MGSVLFTLQYFVLSSYLKCWFYCAMVYKSRVTLLPNTLCFRAAGFGASSFNRALSRNLQTTIVGFNWVHLKITQCTE